MPGILRRARKLSVIGRLARHYAREYDVPVGRQVAEFSRLWMSTGVNPLDYYRLGMFRPDIEDTEKLGFVTASWYFRQVQKINPARIRVIATEKLVSYGILRLFGIPTPTIHGLLNESCGQATDGSPLRCAADLGTLARRSGLSDVCFKPMNSWSGHGFVRAVLEPRSDGVMAARVAPSQERTSIGDLWAGLFANGDTYLCQESLRQHPHVAEMHPSSLNTMRVWMVRNHDGDWRMWAANLRIGVGGATVDNTSAGGIGAVIDNETGALGTAAIRGLDVEAGVLYREFAEHPTTGASIEGRVLPMWDEVRALCARTCEAFPMFRLMGLDVGFGVDRPWIIEVEADPHSALQAYVQRGVRPLIEGLVKGSN